jgi:L-asparagine transporter-like permease
MRFWSAALLLASLGGLGSLLIYGAITGFVREPDEGTAAHLWQLVMAAQLPLGVFFAAAWLPRAPRWAWLGLALQALVVLVNLGVVRHFNL